MHDESFDDKDDDPMALSQLDVISCALGATVLLGLILSVIRVSAPVATSTDRFLDVEFEVSFAGTTSMPSLGVILEGPGTTGPIWLDRTEFHPCAGSLLPGVAPPLGASGSPHFTGAALGFDCHATVTSDARTGRLRIDGAQAGTWRIGIYIRDAQNTAALISESIPRGDVSGWMYTQSSRDAVEFDIPALEIGVVHWLPPVGVKE